MTCVLASVNAYPSTELPLDRCGGWRPAPCDNPPTVLLAFWGDDGRTNRLYLAPRCEECAADSRANLDRYPFAALAYPVEPIE